MKDGVRAQGTYATVLYRPQQNLPMVTIEYRRNAVSTREGDQRLVLTGDTRCPHSSLACQDLHQTGDRNHRIVNSVLIKKPSALPWLVSICFT
jgi:hypothetical protein